MSRAHGDPVDPASPAFVFPQGVDPQGAQANDLRQAFKDAIVIARMAALTMNPYCDPVFERYFFPTQLQFVSNVFRTIANIPLDISIEDLNGGLDPAIQAMITSRGLNPTFSLLSISIGNHPDRSPNSGDDCAVDDTDAYLVHSRDNEDAGLISMCTPVWDYPSLSNILNPPAGWENEIGFGCNNLLDRDSDLMTPAGGVLLHELLHWGFLFENEVPNFETVIPLTSGGDHHIRDYLGPPGGIPDTGYGPYNAPLLKNLPPGPYSVTTNNVDNYVYFALSKYWSIQCTKWFAQSTTPSDAFLRNTAWNRYSQPAQPQPQSIGEPQSQPPLKRSIIHDLFGGYHHNSTTYIPVKTRTWKAL
ncbi:hypothetical protein LTR44_001952 [Exophiala sp. CCFEE 6388]|nr:hypothetical protein LTR44_001952 [Eurotiomycetes sp. CCFEE 6388]